jgi:hypothetical protein
MKKQGSKKRVLRVAKKTIVKKSVAVKKKSAAGVRRQAPLKSELSGYLVVWRHTMDDIPIAFFSDEAAAYKFAEKVSWRDSYKRAKQLDIDCSTPVCFAVCTFEKGLSTRFEFVARKDDAC